MSVYALPGHCFFRYLSMKRHGVLQILDLDVVLQSVESQSQIDANWRKEHASTVGSIMDNTKVRLAVLKDRIVSVRPRRNKRVSAVS